MRKIKYKEEKQKRKRRKWLALGGAAALLVIAAAAVLSNFSIEEVVVEGNEYYTDEEIRNLIIDDIYTSNSLYLRWKYASTPVDIPFISAIEVEMESSHKVKIIVYEKSLVGYIQYLGSNMYFDKDGIIVESTSEVIEDTPLIIGLKFEEIQLYEKLPVKDEAVFNTIVNLTRMLKKSDITPDKIYFNNQLEITLYYQEAKVLLGKDTNLEQKVSKLPSLFPKLEGKSGTLHMENYTEDTKNITFEKE